jgi:iron complex transport system substrate-binding protein
MGTRTYLFSAALIAFTLVGAACQRPAKVDNGPNFAETTGSVPMRIVTDDLERQITIPVNVRRVVSTAPSVTENIFAVGAGHRLVGVTTFCDYPEEAKSIAKIGDTMNPNLETIVALKPDIVIVSTASQLETFMKTLERNGIAVYVMDPMSLKEIFENLTALGTILDTAEAAEAAVKNLKARRWAVGDEFDVAGAVGRKPVFVQISKEPLFTIGGASFVGQIVGEAGGHLLTYHLIEAFPRLSKETAVAMKPEVIILSDSPDNQEPNDAFRNSPAVKNGRVYKINAGILSRPGPRLVDALEQIARHLHPEKFRDK